LTTSDHQTGVFIATIFVMSGYLAYLYEKSLISGVFLGLALMVKAYFIPVFLALCIYLLIKDRKQFFWTALGIILSIVSVLLPTLLTHPYDLYRDVFMYSLTRSQGIDKIGILFFFVKHDFLLVCGLVSGFVFYKKNLLYALFSLFFVLFFIFYKDIYYLYLNYMVSFLCVMTAGIYDSFKEKKYSLLILSFCIILFSIVNIVQYLQSFSQLAKIQDISEITESIFKNKPQVIYGENDITPLLSYLTHTPMLGNIVDTNENIFRKGILNKNTMTHDLFQKKTMVVVHGAYYPEAGIDQKVVSGIVDENKIEKECELVVSQPIKAEGLINRLNLFKCF
jgi:hypothetical protein